MKLIVAVVLACVALAAAAPAAPAAPVDTQKVPQIIRSAFDQQPEGNYVYSFETEDGISKNENGELKTVNDEDNKPREVIVVRGSYSYSDADGKPITITYYADETGFHAEGDSVPKVAARR